MYLSHFRDHLFPRKAEAAVDPATPSTSQASTLATEAIREASGVGREMVEGEEAVAAVADAGM